MKSRRENFDRAFFKNALETRQQSARFEIGNYFRNGFAPRAVSGNSGHLFERRVPDLNIQIGVGRKNPDQVLIFVRQIHLMSLALSRCCFRLRQRAPVFFFARAIFRPPAARRSPVKRFRQ